MKKYFKIRLAPLAEKEAEIMMAALSEINYYAFDEEDSTLNAYIAEEDFDESLLKNLLPSAIHFSKEIIEEQNWNRQWEKSIEPVVVNNFAAIRPSFSKPIINVKFDLVITPKMSFGTGHHATTFLMIQFMEMMDFQNKTVLDFGTGTGILAILAEKCGAKEVWAIDSDEWSIENATENIEANNCRKIIVKKQVNLEALSPVDIVLANINLNVLTEHSGSIKSILKPGGFLLVSGFLQNDEKKMNTVFEEKNVVKIDLKQHGDWLAILFRKL